MATCLLGALILASLAAVLPAETSAEPPRTVTVWPTVGGGANRSGQSSFDTSGNQGQVYWRASLGDDPLLDASAPIIGSDDTIYVCDGHALSALTPQGKVKWTVTNRTIEEGGSGWRTALGPEITVSNQSVAYLSYSMSNDTAVTCWMVAVDANGHLSWKVPTAGLAQGAPAIASDGTIVFDTCQVRGDAEQFLYALHPDGTLRWRMELIIPSSMASVAIGPDDVTYLTAEGTSAPLHGILQSVGLNGTGGWTADLDHSSSCTPVVTYDGRVLVGDDDGVLYAFNSSSGSLLWKLPPTGRAINGGIAAALNGTAYLCTNGTLSAISPDGRVSWTARFGPAGWWDSVAIGKDGSVFVGNCSFRPDGTLRWRLPFSAINPAIQFDGTIVCVDVDGRSLVAIDRAPNAQGAILVLSTTIALAAIAYVVYRTERKK